MTSNNGSSKKKPWGLAWRSNTLFILASVTLGLFSDIAMYGLVVPILPFMLREHIGVPQDKIQASDSILLAAFAGSQLFFSVPVGWLTDQYRSRQGPFLGGLAAMMAGTLMFALGQNMTTLIIARILQGMSGAVVWTVGFALVMDTVGTKHMGKTMGSVYSITSLAILLSPVVGGILYHTGGIAGVFGLGLGILALDFIMRLLVIEKGTLRQYEIHDRQEQDEDAATPPADQEASRDEQTPLLPPTPENDGYIIDPSSNSFLHALPILYIFRDPRLLTGLTLTGIQALLLSSFNATIPTEAQELFDFDALTTGLIFIALDVPYLLFGFLAGWSVDKFGVKPAAATGYTVLVPLLILLRLPAEQHLDRTGNIALYCGILALNGMGVASIGAPAVVESSKVTQQYTRANPKLFGENGPYGQLYGFRSLFYCGGLTLGPIMSGFLRDSIGYGNMNAVLAGVAGVAAILSILVLGGPPKCLQGSASEDEE